MKLTALRANNPVAVMAAYGALRLLPGARLRWDGPHPELEWEGDPIGFLAERLPERRQAPEVTLIDDPRRIAGSEGYRELAGQIPTEWLVAYAAETAEGLRVTDLLTMRDGRHQFVRNALDILATLAKRDIRAKLTEALLGPWHYEDKKLQAWGWDAAARIDAAASVAAVTDAPKVSVLGAYWLAWESLPLWPMVNGRTVGVERHHWVYPTCAEWLGVEGLRSLILGTPRMDERELAALGVTRWRSERIRTGKFGAVLGWAMPQPARTPSERQHPGGFARRETRAVLID